MNIIGNATYLLRFDDITPCMNWKVWDEVERIVLKYNIKAVIAVVPDNRDEHLNVDDLNPMFWDRVRFLQSQGWAVAQHGFQHRYVTSSSGLMGINNYSEFAGLSLAAQTEKLSKGLKIFEDNGVAVDLWVAPGHSFDNITLEALGKIGINVISDGFYFRPVFLKNLLFIPQTLWRFYDFAYGVFTICHHINGWTSHDLEEFERNLILYRERIVGLHELILASPVKRLGTIDYVFSLLFRHLLAIRSTFRRYFK
jgi:peptidoglycan/xylan/chitin deacetylase (PgdA/CDA1 family)